MGPDRWPPVWDTDRHRGWRTRRDHLLKRSTPGPATARRVKLDLKEGQQEEPERAILCAACRHRLTSERQRISVGDSHEHRFFNPHGFLFHIGCFRAAPGCAVSGVPSMEFTWFPGYAWRFALCGGCGEHLGWRFESADAATFFGLILNRLVVSDESQHGL